MRVISKEYARIKNAVQVSRALKNGQWLPVVVIGSKRYVVVGGY